MGGQVLKNASPRLEASAYFDFARQAIARLRAAAPRARFEAIPAYGRKPTFGDLDIVVDWGAGEEQFAHRRLAIDALRPTEVVRRGGTTTLGVALDGLGAPFQVDFIASPAETFEFTLRFFSFNDLGNLVARIAHLAGFKLDSMGLKYTIRNPRHHHHIISEVVVTRDWDQALALLGYDPTTYAYGLRGGFQTLEDIFRFVVDTPYFFAPAYFPENINHAVRSGDARRPTYAAFLQWLEFACDPKLLEEAFDWSNVESRRAEFLQHALAAFPAFRASYDTAISTAERASLAKARLNKERVHRMADLWGKHLSLVWRRIGERFASREAMIDWVIAATDAEIDALILQARAEHLAHVPMPESGRELAADTAD